MKTIFSNSMVAHVWAQQNQGEGRNGNHSFYFSGKTIYSYGEHFPIARFIDSNTVLMTTMSYSSSTSRHVSDTRQAIPSHCKIIEVPNINNAMTGENFKYFDNRLPELIKQYQKARTSKPRITESMMDMVEHANAYAELVKSKRRYNVPTPESMGAIIKNFDKAAKARETKRLNKIEANRLAATQLSKTRLTAWRKGSKSFGSGWFWNLPVALRIMGDKVQTSHGAEFPLKFGEKAYKAIKRCVDTRTFCYQWPIYKAWRVQD